VGAAHALARFGQGAISTTDRGSVERTLSSMPIVALRLEPALVQELRALGFEEISDLLRQPRAPLTLRFGPGLWSRIDQALGTVPELIDPVRPAEVIEVRRAFAEPISAAETIKRYIEQLVEELCAQLEKRGHGVRRLDLVCHRVDARQQGLRIGTAVPTRERKRIVRMLGDKVSEIDPGFGIELMALAATWTQEIEPAQGLSSLIEPGMPDVSDLVDILANRVGEDRLYRAAPVASDVPERSVERIPALAPDSAAGWHGSWPRPSRLLARPEPIETVALLPDHPPAFFTWRGVRRRLKRADGPERVFGEWWTRDAELSAVRDYFRVEDEAGERYWVYRAGDGEDSQTG